MTNTKCMRTYSGKLYQHHILEEILSLSYTSMYKSFLGFSVHTICIFLKSISFVLDSSVVFILNIILAALADSKICFLFVNWYCKTTVTLLHAFLGPCRYACHLTGRAGETFYQMFQNFQLHCFRYWHKILVLGICMFRDLFFSVYCFCTTSYTYIAVRYFVVI